MRELPITPLAAAVFLCGAASAYTFNLVGEVYAAEIVLPLVALLAMFAQGTGALFKEGVFWLLLFSLLATLCGYVISDLLQDTPPSQYLRGWGRVALEVTDFLAAAVLVASDRRNLWWLVLGMGLGGVAQLQLAHVPVSVWKFGYGIPVALSAVALARMFPAKVASVGLAVLGVLNLRFDFRIMAGVCLVLAALLWARSKKPGAALSGMAVLRVALPLAIAAMVLVAGLAMTAVDYTARRAQSNLGRSVGIEVGLQAVAASPLIGYGSWASNKDLDRLQDQALVKAGLGAGGSAAGGRHFSPHSQVLQAWMEGGALGAVFFLVFAYKLLSEARHVALVRALDAYTPILLFFICFSLWNFLMSPFTAPHRIAIAVSCAVLCVLALERRAELGRR